jgi:hypothetical protein
MRKPFENGRGFSLRVLRAGEPERKFSRISTQDETLTRFHQKSLVLGISGTQGRVRLD